MNTLSYKTVSLRKEDVERKWFIIDAEGEKVGRLCTHIASILRGKHKANFTPHVDNGDFIIVINADKIRFSGKKMLQKEYQRYSNYPGGQKKTTAKEMLDKKPFFIVENAVRGMLPKTKLGRKMFRKLFVYAGTEHPHGAQKPEVLSFNKDN